MKKKRILIAVGLIGLLVGMALNAEYALRDYGMRNGWFGKFLLAQTTDTDTTTGNITGSEKECRDNGGYWNLFLTAVDGGVAVVKCEKDGELAVLNYVIKGKYKKDMEYPVIWEHRSCQPSGGNCCYMEEEGVFVLGSLITTSTTRKK